MAEVATKKSINVVSSKKSEVCSVPSNNGLIDLENITASNEQLITLCDNNDDEDDLILTNNTRNDLDTDDKSLQELIESELALRICSNSEEEAVVEGDDQNDSCAAAEPVKRIVLDRREDPLDINTEFIAAESEQCAIIEEPYTYQNGHASPNTKTSDSSYDENVKPEPKLVDFREEEEQVFTDPPDATGTIITQKTDNEEQVEQEMDDQNSVEPSEDVDKPIDLLNTTSESTNDTVDETSAEDLGQHPVDKYEQEEVTFSKSVDEVGEDYVQDDIGNLEGEDLQRKDTWTDQDTFVGGRQGGQFSDNFDETLPLESQCVTSCVIQESAGNLVEKSTIETSELFGPAVIHEEESQEVEEPESKPADSEESITKLDVSDTVKEIAEGSKESPLIVINSDEPDEDTKSILTRQSIGFEESPLSHSESSAEAVSTQEFLDTERRILNEEATDVYSQDDVKTEESSPEKVTRTEASIDDDEAKDELNDLMEDQNQIAESSSDHSVSESTFIEKTEIIVSDNNVTIFSETKCVDPVNDLEHDDVVTRDLDSWTTVEEATRPIAEVSDVEQTLDTTVDEIEPKEIIDENVELARNSEKKQKDENHLENCISRAPLATPDDETCDVSNVCDSESREETLTSSTTSVVTSSTVVKTSGKTKKKKIEGVVDNDASPNLTPRTKKTKKSKKNDLEKENISVNCNLRGKSMHTGPRQSPPEMIDFQSEDDLSNVNVKSLTLNYVSEAARNEHDRTSKEKIATGVSIKQLCRSFGDISNMSDGDQTGFGKTLHTMENEEKARSMGDLRVCERDYSKFTKDALVFTGVSVKALRASYCSLANLTNEGKDKEQRRFEKSSFNKFDALSKKTVLHVRSVDASKVQQQLNSVGQNGDANQNCRSCGKVVFQMEQTKAEGLVWHKNCFRCVQCSKQLNVDNYESHESTLYCKPHFKELFQPKPVEESDQPVRPRKPEMIIRENEPKELPPDVVRASDKPDLGLEELSSLNVKSRFQVFEKANNDTTNEIERSPSQIAVKRSPSILSKLAKFQAKGMDIGVADESLNGIPYEESSESEEEEDADENEETDTEIVKAKRATRERPISFSKMDDIKSRWETTSQQGRREVQREARKEEIAGIRSRLFMGKQGKMKEMYQQAVAGSERVTKINPAEEIQTSTHARSIKERFERGEPLGASDDEIDSSKPKPEKADEEVIAAGISRKSRSLFLELDASAAKTGRPVTPVNPKTPAEAPRRARDAFMGRQVSDDVVRSSDTTEEVHVETSDITNKFKFFESYKEPEKQRKQFRITPPRDGQVKMESPEREIYRDPDVVRADDRVDELVRTDTARKMLSIFRQMEENATKKEVPNGPKPLKRFTPPPEDKFVKQTASDTDEDEEEEGEESEGEESNEERDPNYVRASDKVEDEFLKHAQSAARAKTLCAKFEHWDKTDGKVSSSNHHIAEMEIHGQGEQSSIESASSLRARFESLGSQTSETPRTPKVKVNRFVEIQTTCMDVCESCEKKVYPLEKVETNNKIFHKQCFRCLQCNCVLRMDTFTLNNGKLYCIPHFKQLFITRGNYDEGFGVDPHKNKWSTTSTSNSTSPSPIAVSNGDL